MLLLTRGTAPRQSATSWRISAALADDSSPAALFPKLRPSAGDTWKRDRAKPWPRKRGWNKVFLGVQRIHHDIILENEFLERRSITAVSCRILSGTSATRHYVFLVRSSVVLHMAMRISSWYPLYEMVSTTRIDR